MSRFRRFFLRTGLVTALVSMVVYLLSAVALAAPQTLTILGAYGSPGDVDPYTEYSLDGGQTWAQAYLYGSHPWGFVPGTNSWVNCGPSGFVCLNRSVLYRVRFNVPAGFSNPQMQFDVKADNAATIWVNGTYVTYIVGSGGTTADATVTSAITTGMNEIRLKVDDWGGWAGFNYKITLNVDAPAPPSLLPGGQVADTTPPALTVPGSLTVECSAGSVISASDSQIQAWLQQATATDDVDGQVAVTNDLPKPCTLGTTTVTFTATDAAGNHATARSTITVVDRTAPVTVATAPAGWQKTDVTVTLSASDNLSGVNATYYRVDGGAPQVGTSVTISADGTHTVEFWSEDNAGNPEAPKSVTVQIDKTAPEAYIQLDPSGKNVAVYGRDGLSGVQPGPVAPASVTPVKWGGDDDDDDEKGTAELRTYNLVDQAGNSLVLLLKVKKEGHEVKAEVVSLQYNGAAVVTLTGNSAKFEWSAEKNGTLKELEQQVRAGKSAAKVEAKFDGKKNRTTIKSRETKTAQSGLVLLRMATANGQLSVEY